MGTDRQRTRCLERLGRLATSTLDCESIQREAIADVQRLAGFDRWCWPLADPATLLPLGGIAEHDYGPQVARVLELEYSGGDFAAKDVLARRARLAASLSAETGGDLARSPRWDQVMRGVGIGDIAVITCRDVLGCWGWIEAYRDGGDRPFHDDDLEFLAHAGPALGSALRRGLGFMPPGKDISTPDTTGVIVLNAGLDVVSATAGARAWIDAFPLAWLFAAWGMLPATIYPVAARARAGAAEARALDQVANGRWILIEAAQLEGGARGEIASASGTQLQARHSTASAGSTDCRDGSGRWPRRSSPVSTPARRRSGFSSLATPSRTISSRYSRRCTFTAAVRCSRCSAARRTNANGSLLDQGGWWHAVGRVACERGSL